MKQESYPARDFCKPHRNLTAVALVLQELDERDVRLVDDTWRPLELLQQAVRDLCVEHTVQLDAELEEEGLAVPLAVMDDLYK